MTELLEKIKIHLDNPDSEDCPFCPGKETDHKWKTVKGERNNSGRLRKAMNKPSRCSYAQENGARPKDGKYPHQNIDPVKRTPKPIYRHVDYGDYRAEAHHCISGNEILKGHSLEKIIANESGDYQGQTGYTVNTNANGVYLPSYPKKGYEGNDDEKYKIVRHAMKAGKGQTHIGGHSGHADSGEEDYPKIIKRELLALKNRVLNKSEECPFCVEDDGTAKKPFIPPYKVNQWLDNLSGNIEKKLTGPVSTWPYFISKYAKRYYNESKKTKKSKKSVFS